MPVFVKNRKSEHFYTPEGEPAYGKNIVTARKVGLWPSMSSLNGLLDKYALTIWKMKQVAIASIGEKPFDEETEEDFAARLVNKALDNMEAAPGMGTAVHDLAEAYIKGEIDSSWVEGIDRKLLDEAEIGPAVDPKELKEVFRPLGHWIDLHIKPYVNDFQPWVERSFACPTLKIGGRLDFYGLIDGKMDLADFKTQNVKNGKVSWYDEWGYQFAGYRQGLRDMGQNPERCRSIVISTAPDLRGVDDHVWEEIEIDQAYDVVKVLRELYRLLKGV